MPGARELSTRAAFFRRERAIFQAPKPGFKNIAAGKRKTSVAKRGLDFSPGFAILSLQQKASYVKCPRGPFLLEELIKHEEIHHICGRDGFRSLLCLPAIRGGASWRNTRRGFPCYNLNERAFRAYPTHHGLCKRARRNRQHPVYYG